MSQSQCIFESSLGADVEQFYEPEGRAVPIQLVKEAIAFCEYGSKLSRALKIAFNSGPRLNEIHLMKKSCRYKNFQLWKLGKNQGGQSRQEYFKDDLWAEIEYGMLHDRHADDRICDLSGITILRYFNREIRPHLSAQWHEKVPVVKNRGDNLGIEFEYKYQLKGFRKTFATLMFAYFWKKYGDSNVALEKVSKRMKHSSKWMTLNHYVDMCTEIDAMSYCDSMPFEHLGADNQCRISDFVHLPEHFMERKVNLQLGRPNRMFDRELAKDMLFKKNMSVLEVSRSLNVPRTTIYRLKEKSVGE